MPGRPSPRPARFGAGRAESGFTRDVFKMYYVKNYQTGLGVPEGPRAKCGEAMLTTKRA
jgi:hypothetical protein